MKNPFSTKSFRAGGYSVFAIALVIAIAIAVNLFAGALPESATELDFTANQLYSISDQTRRILNALDKDVTVYWIVADGNEDPGVKNLLSRYEGASSHIKVTKIDPAEYPKFAQQYTSSTVYQNSLVFVCGDMSKYVGYYDIYQQVESENFDTYYYYYYYYGYSQYYDYLYDWVFCGESCFTGAINYVTSDSLPKIVMLTGHGESSLSSDALNELTNENYSYTTLNLLESVTTSTAASDTVTALGSGTIVSAEDVYAAIPEDAAIIMILSPTGDITAAEAEALIKYLDNGGNIVINASLPESGTLENLEKVTAHMGITFNPGIIVESDSYYYYRYPYYLLPDINDTEITSALVDNSSYILYPIAMGLVHSENIGTYEALLTTSAGSYSKAAGYNMTTYTKETGDTDGPFDVAAFVTDGKSHMAVFTSDSFLTDDCNSMVSGANRDLFLNTINMMTEQEEKISIRSKSLESSTLTVASADANRLSIIFIGVVPVSFILIGIIVIIWRKRR